jgi:hypothetical protein
MASPLLACLPNPSMTPAEMECCKKMAGNCDMGGGNHKCCDTTANHSASPAAVVQSSPSHLQFFAALVSPMQIDAVVPQLVERSVFSVFPTSPPLGLYLILKN